MKPREFWIDIANEPSIVYFSKPKPERESDKTFLFRAVEYSAFEMALAKIDELDKELFLERMPPSVGSPSADAFEALEAEVSEFKSQYENCRSIKLENNRLIAALELAKKQRDCALTSKLVQSGHNDQWLKWNKEIDKILNPKGSDV